MTRKEEIEQAAKQSIKGDSFEDGCIGKGYFIIGAEWADKTMLDEICEWIEDNIYDYLYINRDFNEADYKHELIEDLKKAIKNKL